MRGATIYYTTDRSEPNVDGSPATTSASSPVKLDLSDSSFTPGDYVIRAIAVREGFDNSDEGSRTFELTQAPTVGDLTFSASGGASDRSAVSTLDTLTISTGTEDEDATISYNIGEDSSTYVRALSFDELVSLSTAGTSATILITASATKEGYHPSTKSQTFTVTKAETAKQPTFSPTTGNVATTGLIDHQLQAPLEQPIYYSTDRSIPDTSSDSGTRATSVATETFSNLVDGPYPKLLPLRPSQCGQGITLQTPRAQRLRYKHRWRFQPSIRQVRRTRRKLLYLPTFRNYERDQRSKNLLLPQALTRRSD